MILYFMEDFKKWLIKYDNKKTNTANSYARGVKKVRDHFLKSSAINEDIFLINEPNRLIEISAMYMPRGSYSDIGEIGHGTFRAAMNAYCRFKSWRPEKNTRSIKEERQENKQEFTINSHDLEHEASIMGKCYQKFYCLERSIRNLITEVMINKYGHDWWGTKMANDVKENVQRNMEYELDSTHTKRSTDKIDYTTFGDLRKIIKYNWDDFEPYFHRNLNSVNELLIDLNRLRVSIAHCTKLPSKEISRLDIRLSDWDDILNR